MLKQVISGLIVTLAVALLVSTAVAAEKTHEGMVVLVAEGKLTMVDKEGKNEHTHLVAATTKVTLNGKAAKIGELKKADKVKVTTDEGGKVTAIAASREG